MGLFQLSPFGGLVQTVIDVAENHTPQDWSGWGRAAVCSLVLVRPDAARAREHELLTCMLDMAPTRPVWVSGGLWVWPM